MKRQAVIALLTDFGMEDGYVASMKGVILNSSPNCRIIDITHSIQPQNIDQAAFVLWSSYKYFPKDTIFVCIVDPGVGSDRKIICIEGDGYKFLAPDNGILKFILGTMKQPQIFSVNNQKYFLKGISQTFHGRDIFASVAARLANDILVHDLGPKTTPLFHAEKFVEVLHIQKEKYKGKVIHIDRYGNIITNLLMTEERGGKFNLKIGSHIISRIEVNYTESRTKTPFMIIGSTNLIEIAVKNGSAYKLLSSKINQEITLSVG